MRTGSACSILAALAALSQFAPAPAFADPIAPGDAQQSARLSDLEFQVFTYRPSCPARGMLLVFHGQRRNADQYRDRAHSLGDSLCVIVVAPKFTKAEFPSWRYQKGGVVDNGKVRDPRDWSGHYALDLVAWVRRQEGRPLAYSMIGHSAGGQFLSRLAAFTPTSAGRIVIANPSTYVLASLDVRAPFGMGGVYGAGAEEAQLRRYLRAPVTIFLGEDDVGAEDRDDSAEAMRQGGTRRDRGLNTFHAARALARSKGWAFNWRLVEAPGVGHSATGMFSSPQALRALSP